MIGRLEYKTREMSPLELDIRQMVRRHPIELMAPYIAEYDRKTAAFIISVAKKESDWGKHVPKLDGKDCYNYWGYRGNGQKVTWDGYTCFDSREEAVKTVAERFNELIYGSNLDTPQKMIVWKCGWNCDEHSPESVAKWIADVSFYFKKLYKEI